MADLPFSLPNKDSGENTIPPSGTDSITLLQAPQSLMAMTQIYSDLSPTRRFPSLSIQNVPVKSLQTCRDVTLCSRWPSAVLEILRLQLCVSQRRHLCLARLQRATGGSLGVRRCGRLRGVRARGGRPRQPWRHYCQPHALYTQ